MAAAALLRSVASKMLSRAAAAPTHHRSLVARGLHGGARSGPPATYSLHSNQVQQGTADVVHNQVWYRLVHGRGLHSRTCTSPDLIPSTPPKVLHTTALAKARAGVAYTALFGTLIYLHFWAKPAQEEAIAMFETLYKQRSDLINSLQAIIHAQREMLVKLQNTHVSSVSHQTPSVLASGHVDATDQGTGAIDKLGKEEAVKMMHSQANHVKELEAEIAELKIALDSAPSQGKV
ncbi:uncharacterized protein [Miscanthus floridulus]